jgi:hypothetical protein
MSNRPKATGISTSLAIAAQKRASVAEAELDQLRRLVGQMVNDTREALLTLRPHVRAEGLSILDDFLRAVTPPDQAPEVKPSGVQVYRARDLVSIGGGG